MIYSWLTEKADKFSEVFNVKLIIMTDYFPRIFK